MKEPLEVQDKVMFNTPKVQSQISEGNSSQRMWGDISVSASSTWHCFVFSCQMIVLQLLPPMLHRSFIRQASSWSENRQLSPSSAMAAWWNCCSKSIGGYSRFQLEDEPITADSSLHCCQRVKSARNSCRGNHTLGSQQRRLPSKLRAAPYWQVSYTNDRANWTNRGLKMELDWKLYIW